MISGTPALPSYSVDLPHRPRAPTLSPWSLVWLDAKRKEVG
jgi:hypothetical protein